MHVYLQCLYLWTAGGKFLRQLSCCVTETYLFILNGTCLFAADLLSKVKFPKIIYIPKCEVKTLIASKLFLNFRKRTILYWLSFSKTNAILLKKKSKTDSNAKMKLLHSFLQKADICTLNFNISWTLPWN